MEKEVDDKRIRSSWLKREEELDYDALAEELTRPGNEELKSVLTQLDTLQDLPGNQEKMWMQIRQRMRSTVRRSIVRYVWYVAVVFLIISGAWISWFMFGVKKYPEKEVIEMSKLEPGEQRAYLKIGISFSSFFLEIIKNERFYSFNIMITNELKNEFDNTFKLIELDNHLNY